MKPDWSHRGLRVWDVLDDGLELWADITCESLWTLRRPGHWIPLTRIEARIILAALAKGTGQ